MAAPEPEKSLHAVANTPAGRMEFIRSYDSTRVQIRLLKHKSKRAPK